MGNLSKSEIIAKLKELQGNLNELEKAERDIASCEADIKNLNEQQADPKLLRTDHYASKRHEFTYEKSKHRTRRYFITIGLVFLGICLLSFLLGEMVYVGPDWSTPEIIGEYSGSYHKYYSTMDATLNITSCNERGEIEGTFEFFGQEGTLFSNLYGKYSIEGKVEKKGENGDVIATIKLDEWISENPGETPFKDMEIKIYDNYSTVQNLDYEMILCTKGKEIPTDFVSPEIEGDYMEDGNQDNSFKSTIAIALTLSYVIFVAVLAIIVFGMKPVNLNKKQKKLLADLARLDEDNKLKNEDIIIKTAEAFADRKNRELSQHESRLNSARKREAQYKRLCNQSDIIAERDKHLHCVDYLIDQLSNGHADTLKEALNKYENYVYQQRQQTDNFIRQQKEWWDRQNQAQALANMQNAQTAHNYHVQEELKKQTRELEEINERLKELDD